MRLGAKGCRASELVLSNAVRSCGRWPGISRAWWLGVCSSLFAQLHPPAQGVACQGTCYRTQAVLPYAWS